MSGENLTIDVRDGEALDASKIGNYLRDHVAGLGCEPVIRQFPSGASNLTYSLQFGEKELVLRRPPSGTRPKSGHDMGREYRIMSALAGHYPVPKCLHLCEDESIIGAPFYVMEKVDGLLVKAEFPPQLGFAAPESRKFSETFCDLLIDLHSIDPAQVGLADFGKPEGYVLRQIEGWDRRYEKARTPDVDEFSDVRQWLLAHIPQEAGRAAILHGDFRIDNMILDANDPFHVKAVLDWEISALGDPLMDLGNTLAYWIEAEDPVSMRMLARQPSWAPGMMKRDEIIARYGEKTKTDMSGFGFYYAYGVWRLAVIMQQIYYRFYHGQTKNAAFSDFAGGVNALGNYCRAVIEKEN